VTTFCLIHGQWHDGSCWDAVAGDLRARGHTVVAPDLPFDELGAGYATRAAPALRALEGVDDSIVVVGHSAGSAEAAIVASERQASLVVYVCPRFASFAPPPDAPDAFRAGFPFPPRDAEGRGVWEPQAALEVMYTRLPAAVGRALAERLRPGAAPAGDYPLDRHPDLPTALVYAVDDEFFTPEWEQFVAREMLGVEPVVIPGGHFPMVEDPAALADLLDQLAAGV